jgi:DNA-binding transcriptional ArsR family regulator
VRTAEARDDWWETVARVTRHPLRQQLLFKYAESVTSPSAVAAALGVRLNLVGYHTNVLLDARFIELVRTERRRGATEHFYRSVLRSEIGDDGWERLPLRLRRSLMRITLDTSWREAGDALPRGGMDDPSAHTSRTLLSLDAAGRRELAAVLMETLERTAEIERASRRRAGDDTVPCELVVMSFVRASRP